MILEQQKTSEHLIKEKVKIIFKKFLTFNKSCAIIK